MRMRNPGLAFCFLLGLAMLITGQAEAGKLYLGGSVGQSSADITLNDIDDGSITGGMVDDSDTTYKAFVGFRLFKFFALEADWIDLGMASIDATSDGTGTDYAAGPVTATAMVDGYRVSALGVVPLGKRFSVFGRVGYFAWDSSDEITDSVGTIADSDSDEEEFYGAGLMIKFKGALSIRIEHERMTLDDTDVDLTSVGLAFRF